ncbi:hypothetical protein ANTPLA_LOCUS9791 [Anthophora plagiata]
MDPIYVPWVPNDTPYFFHIKDWERPFDRFRYGVKIPFEVGLALGLLRHFDGKTNLYSAKVVRGMLYTAFPFLGLGFFYSSGAFIAGHLRHKEDGYNHVVGALTTIPLIRKCLSFHATTAIAMYGTLFVTVLKIHGVRYRGKPKLVKPESGCRSSFDWYLWSKAKPADSGYLTYSLFK